jgi:hypothetical protein
MQRVVRYTSLLLLAYKMVNKNDMKKALAEIESSLDHAYTAIAKMHSLLPSMVICYVQGK